MDDGWYVGRDIQPGATLKELQENIAEVFSLMMG
jgi:hypothetical protein